MFCVDIFSGPSTLFQWHTPLIKQNRQVSFIHLIVDISLDIDYG